MEPRETGQSLESNPSSLPRKPSALCHGDLEGCNIFAWEGRIFGECCDPKTPKLTMADQQKCAFILWEEQAWPSLTAPVPWEMKMVIAPRI